MTIDAVFSEKICPPERGGPPTREELELYYPAKFTWKQLKTFVNSGDLGLLKRDKALQRRYDEWAKGVKQQYGSMVNYLLQFRLQWGEPDTFSLLPSTVQIIPSVATAHPIQKYDNGLPVVPSDGPKYFTSNTEPEFISIIQNDWPYSVPTEVEHTLVWTCIPILPPPHLLPDNIATALTSDVLDRVTKRLEQDGIWGFTGQSDDSPPPSPSLLPRSLGALSEWGITMEKLVRSPKGTPDEDAAVTAAGHEVQIFVESRWDEHEWETAWFVNPPRLQSVKGLAHIHVFARRKHFIGVGSLDN
ncbi:hypothetical protein BD410DRAFT_747072 [Rickenella mellea]|uniref:Uncharacterized protein n=1 Tax=Rickenella mellea TaxID=50990 RepID=A0A4Y7Q6R3_9AGAM|nr:hypothetical protein BD410DRAFT_747072 [Rickenella mellea]